MSSQIQDERSDERRGPINFELQRVSEREHEELRRMYAAHTRVLHEFDPNVEPGRELEDDWWNEPDDLFAYLILVDRVPAGFFLVLGQRYIEALDGFGDWCMWEMYLEPEHRGTGLAERAVREVVGRFPGRWYLLVLPPNTRAMRFWRRVLARQPGGVVEDPTSDGMALFRFDSHGRELRP